MDFAERDLNDWVLEESDRHTFIHIFGQNVYFDSIKDDAICAPAASCGPL